MVPFEQLTHRLCDFRMWKLATVGWIFVVLLLPVSQATTCTPTTASTCYRSLRVSGTCDTGTGQCGCSPGYSPIATGCGVAPSQAVVTSGSRGEFSGEVFTDGTVSMVLKCTHAGYDGTPQTSARRRRRSVASLYRWYQGPSKTIISTASSSSYTVTNIAVGTTQEFRCALINGPVTFSMSEPFYVTGYGTGGTINQRPVVSGMPPHHVTGGQITLLCTNLPFDPVLTFLWDNTGGQGPATTLNLIETAPSGDLTRTCTIGSSAGRTFASATSLPVTSSRIEPSAVSVEMSPGPTLTISQGTTATLTCQVQGGVALPAGKPEWAWHKNGSVVLTTTNTHVIGAADTTTVGSTIQFTCYAVLGGTTSVSASATVKVVSSSVQDVAPTSVQTGAITGGYFALVCTYTASAGMDLSFSWLYNSHVIPGQTDYMLQMNDVSANNDGEYTCVVHSSANRFTSIAYRLSTGPLAINPSISPFSGFLAGQKYTMVCASMIKSTPGMDYEWFVDTTLLGTGPTLSITATTSAVAYKCKISFAGDTKEATRYVLGAYLKHVYVNGPDLPMAGMTTRLTCEINIAPIAPSPVYKWLESGVEMAGETASTVELSVGSEGTRYSLVCEVTTGGTTLISRPYPVAAMAIPSTPTVISVSSTTTIQPSVCYDLSCASLSDHPSATFQWSFTAQGGAGKTVLPTTTKVHTILSASNADAGSYTCKITVKGVTSGESNPLVLSYTAKQGKVCTRLRDCIQDHMMRTIPNWQLTYTGSCVGGVCGLAPGATSSNAQTTTQQCSAVHVPEGGAPEVTLSVGLYLVCACVVHIVLAY